MTKIKKTAVVLVAAAMLLFADAVPSFASPESGGAVLSQQDDKYVPLYTTAPDSSFENYTASSTATKRDYALFYTQTTLLALIAGYLVLFKVKGINHDEKMHRRKK